MSIEFQNFTSVYDEEHEDTNYESLEEVKRCCKKWNFEFVETKINGQRVVIVLERKEEKIVGILIYKGVK